jgi:hypothetical protein
MKFDPRAFDRALDEFGKKLQRPTAFMARPAEEWFYQTEREQFDSQGGAGAAGTWPHLAASTVRAKERDGRGTFPTLQRAGNLKNVLTGAGSLRQLIEVTDNKIVFYLPSPAGFHQRGTRKMPARKVVDPSPAQVERLGEKVRREAVEQVRSLGLKTKV